MSEMKNAKETAFLRAFAAAKIPLLAWLKPVVVDLTEERCEIRVPLGRRTRNHLGSMYFGVLCAGADMAGGYVAMRRIRESGRNVAFVFKEFRAEFMKRAEGDVHFICEEGRTVASLVQQAVDTPGTRVEAMVPVIASVPSKLGDEPVARFELTASLKMRR